MSRAFLVESRCAWSEGWRTRGVSLCKWIANPGSGSGSGRDRRGGSRVRSRVAASSGPTRLDGRMVPVAAIAVERVSGPLAARVVS